MITSTKVRNAAVALNLTNVQPMANNRRKNLSILISFFKVSRRSLDSDRAINNSNSKCLANSSFSIFICTKHDSNWKWFSNYKKYQLFTHQILKFNTYIHLRSTSGRFILKTFSLKQNLPMRASKIRYWKSSSQQKLYRRSDADRKSGVLIWLRLFHHAVYEFACIDLDFD